MPRRHYSSPHPDDGRAIAWHVMSRLRDRRVIARNTAQIRSVVRTLRTMASRVGVTLLAFAVVDTHIHFVAVGPRFRVGEVARRVESAVVQRLALPVGFDRCSLKPIHSQTYLDNCVRYVLSQQAHHGTTADPYLEGSALHELLGMRPSTMRDSLRSFLPRITDAELADLARTPGPSPLPIDRLATELVPATVAAFLLSDDAAWSRRGAGPLRAASVQGALASVPTAPAPFVLGAVAAATGLTTRQLQRLAHRSTPSAWPDAVARQLRYRVAMQEAELARRAQVPATTPPLTRFGSAP